MLFRSRSFNDLNQYPIFPWVISNYKHKHISLADHSIYRPLNITISGLSEEMRKLADTKLMKHRLLTDKYQFDMHYFSYQSVLSYMGRVEPYASLMQNDEQIFPNIIKAWINTAGTPNIELIPEFYYFPEIVCNYNFFIFKTNDKYRKVINDMIMPPWSHNNHSFVYKSNQIGRAHV